MNVDIPSRCVTQEQDLISIRQLHIVEIKEKDGALHLIPCGLLLLYGVVKTEPCREAITITEPITHMDMKKAFRLITRVGKLPDAQPDPDRIHGTITGCLMELQT